MINGGHSRSKQHSFHNFMTSTTQPPTTTTTQPQQPSIRRPNIKDVLISQPSRQIVPKRTKLLKRLMHSTERQISIPDKQNPPTNSSGELLGPNDPSPHPSRRLEPQQQIGSPPVPPITGSTNRREHTGPSLGMPGPRPLMREPQVQRGQQPGHLGVVERVLRGGTLGTQPPALDLAGAQMSGRPGRVRTRCREGVNNVDELRGDRRAHASKRSRQRAVGDSRVRFVMSRLVRRGIPN